MSRPDISYHMSILASFMQNPSMECFEAAQSLLLYVGKTRDLSIHYSSKFNVPDCLSTHVRAINDMSGIHAFFDSSWTVPRSHCGYGVWYCGGPIAYGSRKLNVIADSSALAEYAAGSLCSKELSFVRHLLRELHAEIKGPIVVAADNTASISISEKNGVTKLTKHFDFCVARLRHEVQHNCVLLHHVGTDDQTADIFTKALDEKTFLHHRGAFFS